MSLILKSDIPTPKIFVMSQYSAGKVSVISFVIASMTLESNRLIMDNQVAANTIVNYRFF